MNDYLVSLIRTFVPVGVGTCLAWLGIHFGFIVDQGTSSSLKLGAAGLVISGYYAVARGIEHRWPTVGRLLTSLALTSRGPTYR